MHEVSTCKCLYRNQEKRNHEKQKSEYVVSNVLEFRGRVFDFWKTCFRVLDNSGFWTNYDDDAKWYTAKNDPKP